MTTNVVNPKVTSCNVHHNLIEACRKNDQRAQFQIYKLYYKAMYNVSLRIVNDAMEAEDIMQEAFLTAFEEIAGYSGKVSFGAWLKRIVQNRSVDYLRKKGKITFEDIASVREVENNLFDNPGLIEEPEVSITRMMAIIKRLPEKCRNIFSLYFLEGYDHEEIGQILSISSSTSRSQLSRARLRFIREYKMNTQPR